MSPSVAQRTCRPASGCPFFVKADFVSSPADVVGHRWSALQDFCEVRPLRSMHVAPLSPPPSHCLSFVGPFRFWQGSTLSPPRAPIARHLVRSAHATARFHQASWRCGSCVARWRPWQQSVLPRAPNPRAAEVPFLVDNGRRQTSERLNERRSVILRPKRSCRWCQTQRRRLPCPCRSRWRPGRKFGRNTPIRTHSDVP